MSLDSYSTKQAVIFISFMKNHKYGYLYYLLFIKLFFKEVGFHEPGLIFMKIHRNTFVSVYRIDPRSLFPAHCQQMG